MFGILHNDKIKCVTYMYIHVEKGQTNFEQHIYDFLSFCCCLERLKLYLNLDSFFFIINFGMQNFCIL
jgi:hypothetical protein